MQGRCARRGGWLLDDALTSNAPLIAAHIATPGRLVQDGDTLRWSDV